MASIIVGHPIREQTNEVAYNNMLNNFNVGFTLSAVFLFSFFSILALSFLINEFDYRNRFRGRRIAKLSKRIALTLSKFQKRTLSAVGVFVLFTHLFLWLTQLFLTNNIKTNKVVSSNSILN